MACNDVVLRGQIDRLGILDHILDVFLGDLAVRRNDRMNAAIVEAANVAAGHAKIHAANFHVGHLLGFDDGVADVLADVSGASTISPLRTPRERAWPTPMMFSAPLSFTSPTTAQTLEVPNFQADNDWRGVKHVFSYNVKVSGSAAARKEPRQPPASERERCSKLINRALQFLWQW